MRKDMQLITLIAGYGLTLVVTMGLFAIHTSRGAPVPPPGHRLIDGKLYKHIAKNVWKEVDQPHERS